MLKRFITPLLLVILVFSPVIALAHEAGAPHKEDEKVTESTEGISEVNSFELFWPMVAGKTMDDGFIYSLKLLKEKIRGWFIFGPSQKADYQIFLATKRVLEAEALLKEGKDKHAIKTLNSASAQFFAAQKSIEKAKRSDDLRDVSQMRSRAENINKLVSWLSTKEEEESKRALEKVDKEVNLFLQTL